MDDRIVIGDLMYEVLSAAEVNSNKYIYVAKIEDDDITGEFYLYRLDGQSGNYIKVTDPAELKKVLVIVASKLM